jgi:hypothetical protein
MSALMLLPMLLPFALGSIPAAYLGGAITLPGGADYYAAQLQLNTTTDYTATATERGHCAKDRVCSVASCDTAAVIGTSPTSTYCDCVGLT